MKPAFSTFWRIALCALLLAGLFAPASQPAVLAAPDAIIVDGVIDAAYGAPIASDPAGDGNGNTNMDLRDLYIAQDATNYYFAFTINANIQTTNWGKYVIYVDTTNNASGATTDAWQRNVRATDPHKPEYGLYSWVDCGTYNASCTQFWQWGGSSWSQSGSVDEAARVAGTTSVIEWRVAKSRLGSPSQIWAEVWDTGGGDTDNAQDTINDPADDWNATNWSAQANILVSTQYPPVVPIELSITFPPEGYYTGDPDITLTGVVSPTTNMDVYITVNGTDAYTPTVGVSGDFSQPLTLDHGANTIEIEASDGINANTVTRHVQVGADHDNNILWDQLGHNSRDPLYRNPGGPVTTDTSAMLRFRAASGDLTGVQARVWNDRINAQFLLDMEKVADDGDYEWWQATVPASAVPTVYWYRFIAKDGSKTAYYEDDASPNGRPLGGWGKAYNDSPDLGWQLTVYDPAFQTPDWIKNAIVYQIFPDRFKDGDPANNTPAGTFFYNESPTIYRSNATDWNTVICDPRVTSGPCQGSYSKNFYGGDLDGLIAKLNYLDDLGVTAIYLNPIFEAPSNHKYDTTDFSVIDDNFGDLATFITLTQQAEALGMNIILDGVFNHSSSDSIYFDRYGRYSQVGACESQNSPYRSWYYFHDVTPGTGSCVSSTGVPNAATYESWFGYDSLPKLRANDDAVRDLIWADGTNSIAPFWIDNGADGFRLDVAGDVDPGTTSDPTNTYWEGFRTALHAVNPNAYIVGEEWGYATSWTIGVEWDATMNYQFGSAIKSFWRDTPFTDNDHNSGSSAGVLVPITPSQLDERLHNLQERYAPEAFYAMMNLVDSHDTNRVLFQLDPNTGQNDTSLYLNPNYDWSEAITRLKGVAILQMTLPGAPTIYYGDEVGLVGPTKYVVYGPNDAKWEDDPYNRQPFPWLDETGLPFYTSLQSQANQDSLKNFYKSLIAARNTHAALRTGSFDTLLTDDAANVYAYGRMSNDHSDAAVVILNRDDLTQTITLDVSGYLPFGATLANILGGNASYTVNGSGEIIIEVPGLYGAVLVLTSSSFTPPAAVNDLAVSAENDEALTLDWSAPAGANSYDVYRSILSGGGYEWVAHTTNTIFTDTGLTNSWPYYYIVVSQNDATGLTGADSNEASGIPHAPVDDAILRTPVEITHTIGITPTADIFGDVLITGITSLPGAAAGVLAEIGFGPQATPPISWTEWVPASYVGEQAPGFDEYAGQLTPEASGDFYYVYRFSVTNGREWVYADSVGLFDPAAAPANPGVLHVIPAADVTGPNPPQNLALIYSNAGSIVFEWDANTEPDLAGYDVYRAPYSPTVKGPGPFTHIGRVGETATAYTDTAVTTNESYEYFLSAFDRNFNFSTASDSITGTAISRPVTVTFRVGVPAYTPEDGTVYVVGSIPELASWSPGNLAMTEVTSDTWEYTVAIADGTSLEYKYTRGSWDTVESWGSITGLTNRKATIHYGTTGLQVVEDTATDWGVGPDDHKAVKNWRDPLVVSFTPADGATGVPVTTTIEVTWSHSMTNTAFTVTGPGGAVSGDFTYNAAISTTIFTPDGLDGYTTYTVTVAGQHDIGGGIQQVPVTFHFTTGYAPEYEVLMPLVMRNFTPILHRLNTEGRLPKGHQE